MDTIKWEIALTQEFQRSQLNLGHNHREAVQKTLLNLQKGLESPHLHKLEGGIPFSSFGVNRDALRIICKREGNLLILLHVNNHDESYRWAKRHRVVQIGSYVRILRTLMEEEVQEQEPALEHPPGPLHHVRNKEFRYFEVSSGAADVLRQVPDENTLLELIGCFKTPIAEALLGLATDSGDLDNIVRDYHKILEQEQQRTMPTLSDAIHADVNAENFWVVPEQEGALHAALQADLESWRVFLHPSQKRLAKRNDLKAYKVTGGPGTGKTVLALHRARELAENIFVDEKRPLLVTTFSRVLTRELKASLERLCADKPALLERFECKTIVQVAQAVLTKSGQSMTFFGDDVVDSCWDEAMKYESLGRPREFYIAEREHIVARQGVWTAQAYSKARRAGRSSRLNRAARQKVWKVIEAFEQAMSTRKGGDSATLSRMAAETIRSGQMASPYAAIVCDELQDVGAGELRLLAMLAKDEASEETRPNALFLVGDNYQSLYRKPVPMSQCGIQIQGRASVLRCNYRTTEGIRKAAIQVVQDLQFPSDHQEEKSLEGYYSARQGAPPEEHHFSAPEAEADWLFEQIQANKTWPFLILARTTTWLEKQRTRLQTRGISSTLLGAHDAMTQDARVVMCTLHRSKGLEAPKVAIIGCQQVPRPWHGKGDESEREVWEKQEKCLLYVGMTRARDWCALSRVGAR